MSNSATTVQFPVFKVSERGHSASFGLVISRRAETSPFDNRRTNFVEVRVIALDKDVPNAPTPTTTADTPPFVVFTEGWLRANPSNVESEEMVFLTQRQTADILSVSSPNHDKSNRVVFLVQDGITLYDLKQASKGLGASLLNGEIPLLQRKPDAMASLISKDLAFIEQPANFAGFLTGMTLDDMIKHRRDKEMTANNYYLGNASRPTAAA